MKRRSSSSSSLVGAAAEEGLISICPPPLEEEKGDFGNDGGFPSIADGLEDDDCGEEDLCSPGKGAGRGGRGSRGGAASSAVATAEKMRRLSVDQVKALERNFEVENKLEPERKVRLAQELGLQPRQVAVWFQNRRARWKTKQLERDYALLKSNYDEVQLSLDALRADHQALLAEIKELRAKLSDRDDDPRPCSAPIVKEEPAASESDNKVACSEAEEEVVEPEAEVDEEVLLPTLIYKEVSSVDSSDSSAVLNAGDDNNSNSLRHHHYHRDSAGLVPAPPTAVFDGSSTKCCSNAPPFYHYSQQQTQHNHHHHHHHQLSSSPPSPPLLVRMVEEHNLLMGDEPCSGSFFSDEQPPTMPWYCSDQWS